MNCKSCGNELPDNAKFCLECGEKVKVNLTCSSCGAELPLGAKFCFECGAKIGNQTQQTKSSDVNDKTKENDIVPVKNTVSDDNKNYGANKFTTFPLYGKTLSVSEADVKFSKVLDSYKVKYGVFILNEYKKMGTLGTVVENFSDVVASSYRELIGELLDVVKEKNKRYDLTVDNLVDSIDGPIKVFKLCDEFIIPNYNKYMDQIAEAKYERQRRKESRTRVSGSGNSLGSWLTAQAISGAINVTTGMAHSAYNSIDGAITDSNIKDKMNAVYNEAEKNLWAFITFDIENIVMSISREYLWPVNYVYSFTVDKTNRAENIIDSIINKQVPREEWSEQIVCALQYDVRIKDAFKTAYWLLEDPNGELVHIAKTLKLDSVLEEIEHIKTEKSLRKIERDFDNFVENKENFSESIRETIIEFKNKAEQYSYIEEDDDLYEQYTNLLEKIDEGLYDVEDDLIGYKLSNVDYKDKNQVADTRKYVLNNNFNEELVERYYPEIYENLFNTVDKNDREAIIEFKRVMDEDEYLEANTAVYNLVDEAIVNVEKDILTKAYNKVDFENHDSVSSFRNLLDSCEYNADVVNTIKKNFNKTVQKISDVKIINKLYEKVDTNSIVSVYNFLNELSRSTYSKDAIRDFSQIIVPIKDNLDDSLINSEINRANHNCVEELRNLREAFNNSGFSSRIKNKYSAILAKLVSDAEDNILSDCDSELNIYRAYVHDKKNNTYYYSNNIDREKVKSFKNNYREKGGNCIVSIDNIVEVMYYDSTMLGGGEDGMLVSDKAIYIVSNDKAQGFWLNKISGVEFSKGFFSNDMIIYAAGRNYKYSMVSKSGGDEAFTYGVKNLIKRSKKIPEYNEKEDFFTAVKLPTSFADKINNYANENNKKNNSIINSEVKNTINVSNDDIKVSTNKINYIHPERNKNDIITKDENAVSEQYIPRIKSDVLVSVFLKDSGAGKINVIKAVREITGLGLKDAKMIVDSAPALVVKDIELDEAEFIVAKLESNGAKVEIR